MQEIETGCFVTLDGIHHGGISAVGDSLAEAVFLAFQLEPVAAGGATIITGLGAWL